MRSPLHAEHYTVHGLPRSGARSWAQNLEQYSPYVLSILRIVVALLFMEHGTSRLFGFPSPLTTPPLFTMYWFAGAIEFVGGALLLVGLAARPAALIMSGEMAFAYFLSHAPHGFFPSSTAATRRSFIASCSSTSALPAPGPGASTAPCAGSSGATQSASIGTPSHRPEV